jgi:hypothetical protein
MAEIVASFRNISYQKYIVLRPNYVNTRSHEFQTLKTLASSFLLPEWTHALRPVFTVQAAGINMLVAAAVLEWVSNSLSYSPVRACFGNQAG